MELQMVANARITKVDYYLTYIILGFSLEHITQNANGLVVLNASRFDDPLPLTIEWYHIFKAWFSRKNCNNCTYYKLKLRPVANSNFREYYNLEK